MLTGLLITHSAFSTGTLIHGDNKKKDEPALPAGSSLVFGMTEDFPLFPFSQIEKFTPYFSRSWAMLWQAPHVLYLS
jgi:hypothetical protein